MYKFIVLRRTWTLTYYPKDVFGIVYMNWVINVAILCGDCSMV